MIRIPNPVSNVDVFIRVFRDIYPQLMDMESFRLDNISSAMIDTHNVTSQGAIGIEALNRSTRDDRSRDPIYNQSKMYAELFRTLGWIQSTSSSLTYTISLLGDHIASAQNPNMLMKECLLGIAYPNEVLAVSSSQTIRVFATILVTMKELSYISRDEMIAGPMSISNDTNDILKTSMLTTIENCRNQNGALSRLLQNLAKQEGITVAPTMHNYTRIPIAALVWAGWGVKDRRVGIRITLEGQEFVSRYTSSCDIRMNDFNNLPDNIKPAFIRLCHYQMLQRSGFDTTSVDQIFEQSKKVVADSQLFPQLDFTFSPFQQLSRATLSQWTPELVDRPTSEPDPENMELDLETSGISRSGVVHINYAILSDNSCIQETVGIGGIIKSELEAGKETSQIITQILANLRSMRKEEFYPAVRDLLSINGYQCFVSRAGQNYARADAIIQLEDDCIPVEIKSATEEVEISLKAVRQALENKIVFLSRQFYPSNPSSNSLVVGFQIPNERAEVFDLIEDIYNTFGIKIGVIGVLSLLQGAIATLSSGKRVQIENLQELKGVLVVDNSTSI